MSLATSKSALLALTKELMLHWEETKHAWRDVKSLEFEREHLQELVASVDKAVEVIGQLDKLLARIKSDCE